jgi:membrane protease YdiL (CAAX protease family)
MAGASRLCDAGVVLYSLLPVGAALGRPASVVVALTVAYLVLIAPAFGRRGYRRLVAAERVGDPTALERFYRRNLIRKCLWLVPIGLVLLLGPGIRPEQLGLAWPSGPISIVYALLTPFFLAGFVVSTLVLRRWVRRGWSVPGQQAFVALVPRTPTERRWALWVAVAAGVIEELLFRGLLLAAGLSAGLSPLGAVLLTSALFGVMHLYQGWRGIVLTSIFGAIAAVTVVSTGSLLWAILVHVLVDVRAFLLVPRAAFTPSAANADHSASNTPAA